MSQEKNKETRGKVLTESLNVINGERQDSYGNPEDSFKIIAEYWTTYLKAEGILVHDKKLSPKNTTIMMSLFKHARMSGQGDKLDNYRDAGGYIGIASDMLETP
jgi:hypothetical protein